MKQTLLSVIMTTWVSVCAADAAQTVIVFTCKRDTLFVGQTLPSTEVTFVRGHYYPIQVENYRLYSHSLFPNRFPRRLIKHTLRPIP